MPNWCNNSVRIEAKTPTAIKKLKEFREHLEKDLNEYDFFNFFVPMPEEAENDWHKWCRANWGTKWDAEVDEGMIYWDDDGNGFDTSFQTAWCPPIEFYQSLCNQDFWVEADYDEPGVGYCGKWKDGIDRHTDYDDIPETDEQTALISRGWADQLELNSKEVKKGDLLKEGDNVIGVCIDLNTTSSKEVLAPYFDKNNWYSEFCSISSRHTEAMEEYGYADYEVMFIKYLAMGETRVETGILQDGVMYV